MKGIFFFFFLFVALLCTHAQVSSPGNKTAKQLDERADSLLKKLTLKEKISLLGFESPAIDHVNIPSYNWWNEALHGVARAGTATVFPQTIGLSATFNDSLIYRVSTVISTEARAKYNLAIAENRRIQYMGLSFWTPNINIFRDPRWGRGQETYGEDPYLTATMATAFVKGLQGNNPNFLKTAACAKHFVVHSGPEAERHGFNAVVDEKDLRETYLYSFKKLVDAGVNSVMCAYNSVNGEPCCTSPGLLQHILRDEWKFTGQMVTDCGALNDEISGHKAFTNRVDLAAAAVKASINMECGNILQNDVMEAVNRNLLTEDDVNKALKPTLITAEKLGIFSDNPSNPYKNYAADSVHNAAHIALARKAARQSMVLLKNDGVLPLQAAKYPAILVTGANASSLDALMGNYHGIGDNMVTFAEGIAKAAGPATAVQYDQGCDYTDTTHFGGLWVSGNSDVTIAVLGLTPVLEGEEGDAFLSASGGDRSTLSIPRAHIKFLQKLRAASKKPLIAVITAGSPVNIAELEPYADAIILAWYPGEQGGNALADIIFGKVSPSGHLPVTFYKSLADLPNYKDYNMKDRTYRYFTGQVQYPFGFGLSYTSFNYRWAKQCQETVTGSDTLHFSVNIQNYGNYSGDEVVQAYIEYPNMERMPIKELKAFKKVFVPKGSSRQVNLAIPVSELQKWDLSEAAWKLYRGSYTLCVGNNSANFLLKKTFTVK
ncbi:MAG TPA: glycoside hydrolase family 3 C-terminal domain-containing protein [Chitinophagaceae bacterium]|nr:glycoside hydrolase family 3 C-terminal domain-containing protein [Chitinophagaceae bacterium]